MSYLEKFIEAVKYKNELFPNEKSLDIETYKSYSISGNISKRELSDVKEICLDCLSEVLCKCDMDLRLGCSLYSELLKECLCSNGYDGNEISFTVGDVSYRGKYIYNLNEEKLRCIVEAGRQRDKTLDVHAWITYKSTFVFDSTIKSNVNISKDRNNVEDNLLSWDENNKQEFDYLPLLVDNNFYFRVDEFEEQFIAWRRSPFGLSF